VHTATVMDVLDGVVRADQAVRPSPWEGVDVLPSDFTLQRFDQTRLDLLRERLHGWAAHDVVLIDCPPTLGLLTHNALVAADLVMVVTEASFPALRGVDSFLDTFDGVRTRHNPELRFGGVILNALDRSREQRLRLRELREAIEADAIWEPVIPRRAVIAESLGAGRTLYDPESGRPGAEVAVLFEQLADKLVAQLPKKKT
jgi:chromosome partitioning protein